MIEPEIPAEAAEQLALANKMVDAAVETVAEFHGQASEPVMVAMICRLLLEEHPADAVLVMAAVAMHRLGVQMASRRTPAP